MNRPLCALFGALAFAGATGCRAPLPPPKVCEAPPPEAKPQEIGVCEVEPALDRDAGAADAPHP